MITSFANLTVVPNCTIEEISLNKIFPESNEDLFINYTTFKRIPMLQLKMNAGEYLKINLS